MSATAATSTLSPVLPASPHMARDIDLACVRALFQQIPNSFAAAMVVTIYMVLTLWQQVDHGALLAWMTAQALAQVHRFKIGRAHV